MGGGGRYDVCYCEDEGEDSENDSGYCAWSEAGGCGFAGMLWVVGVAVIGMGSAVGGFPAKELHCRVVDVRFETETDGS